MMAEHDTRLPVTILTGFLGAGKTTLLNELVKDPMLANAALIINEFGDVGIDHSLVETSDDTIIEMSSGCLCCTIRGDLINTLHDLLARRDSGSVKPFDRIVIETTGLADPAPVLHTLMSDPLLLARCQLEGVVTLVDAVNGSATLDAYPEAVKQVAVADRVVLTKLDLLSGREGEDAMFAIIARLRKLAPGARLLTTHRGEATAPRLLNCGLYSPAGKSPDVARWLNHEAHSARLVGSGGHAHSHGPVSHDHTSSSPSRHDAAIRSFALVEERAISPQGLEMFLDLVRGLHGANLLRMKAIIKLSDDPLRPIVLHGVQHVFHPPVRLDRWYDGDMRSRLVIIGRDVDAAAFQGLLAAFADQVQAAALTDKTLSLNR